MVQGEQLLGHTLAIRAVVLRCWRLRREVGDLDGEFGAEEEGEVEEAGPGEGGVATREGLEGVINEMGVWALADVG